MLTVILIFILYLHYVDRKEERQEDETIFSVLAGLWVKQLDLDSPTVQRILSQPQSTSFGSPFLFFVFHVTHMGHKRQVRSCLNVTEKKTKNITQAMNVSHSLIFPLAMNLATE